MRTQIIKELAILVLTAVPFSLIIVSFLKQIFHKYNPKIKGITAICTETVGILTHGEQTVKTLIFDKYRASSIEGNEYMEFYDFTNKETTKVEQRELSKEECIKIMSITTALCHFPKLQKIENIAANFFKKCNIHEAKIKDEFQVIYEVPTSKNKKISTIIALNNQSKEIFSFSKGNPKDILDHCSRMLYKGQKVEITPEIRRKLRQKIKRINKKGEKAIAFAYKGLPLKRYETYSSKFAENDLVLVGIMGFGNYTNKDLIPYIEKIKERGIKIYVTSRVRTRKANAIAQELHIVNTNYFEVIEKDYLHDLNDQKLSKLLENKEKDYVFSYLNKEDKERIIRILKENGEKIITTNKKDLTFDKISTSLTNKELTKTYTKKAYLHTISIKIIQLLIIITAILFRAPLPFSIFTVLLIDIIFNTALQISLSQEDGHKKSNYHLSDLITRNIIVGSLFSFIYIFSLSRYGWFPGEDLPENTYAYSVSASIIFFLIISKQILNAYRLKTNKSLLSNPYLLFVSTIILIITISLLNYQFFNLSIPESTDWLIITFLISSILITEKFSKYIIRKYAS